MNISVYAPLWEAYRTCVVHGQVTSAETLATRKPHWPVKSV